MDKEKIEKLKKAIASSATPEVMKEKMRDKLAELEKEPPMNIATIEIKNPVETKKVVTIKGGKKENINKYKLGDKYKQDFDDEGMFKMALKSNILWGEKKLRKLFDSFEDLNYHSTSEHLWKAISFLKEGDKDSAEKSIKNFHSLVKLELKDMGVPVKEARGLKEALDQKPQKESVKKSKSFDEQFEELKKQDPKKLRDRCDKIMVASEKRKAKAKESTKERESKDESTRAVDTGIKTASALTSLAEKADLSDEKQKQFLELMKQLLAVIAGIKKVLGGGALSKEQKEAFKEAVSLED